MPSARTLRIDRSTIVFVIGSVVYLYEAFVRDISDPTVTMGALAAMGVGAFLKGVEIVRKE